ncbi:IclR family transcriptional regulator [Williamsia sp. SKLECPSW1]
MPGLIQSVERATAVLHLLAARDEPVALSEIATGIGVARSTAHGLVRTLVAGGVVDQDVRTGDYSLVVDALLPRRDRWDHNEIRARALNWTDALASRTRLATQVTAVRGGEMVVVHDVLGSSVRGGGQAAGTPDRPLPTGSTPPVHVTAFGRVHLAHDAHLARVTLATDLPAHTARTITDPDALAQSLARVREDGWCCVVGDHIHDLATLAVPVRDNTGTVMAVVGVTGATARICGRGSEPQRTVLDQVVAAGRSISREFGHGRRP